MRSTISTVLLALLLAAPTARAADAVDMAAAKREGTVSWYTSTPIAMAQTIADQFTKATGIKVELFRSGGEAVIRRFMQENAAGRAGADLLTTSDQAAATRMARAGTFVAFKPAHFDEVPAEVKDANGAFVAQRLNMLLITVRTAKVPESQRPKAWSDLAKPAYKGMMVMPDPAFTALQLVVVATLSKQLGWPFYEALRKNDTMIVEGHQQVYEMLRTGERSIGAESVDPRAYTKGKPVPDMATIYPSDGAFAIAAPTGIVKNCAHPNAAKALADFMLSDTVQNLLPAGGFYAARTDIPPPPDSPPLAKLKLMPLDYPYIEKNTQAIKQHFAEIFQ